MFCPNVECLDFVEGGVHGEYVDTVTVCPVCGARLVERLPEQPEAAPSQRRHVIDPNAVDAALVPVAAFGSRQDAELAMSLLEAHGITVFESADDVGGALPDIGFSEGTRLLVPEPQVGAAIALLEGTGEDRAGGTPSEDPRG